MRDLRLGLVRFLQRLGLDVFNRLLEHRTHLCHRSPRCLEQESKDPAKGTHAVLVDFDAMALEGKRHLAGEQAARRFPGMTRSRKLVVPDNVNGLRQGIKLALQALQKAGGGRMLLLEQDTRDQLRGGHVGNTQKQPEAGYRSMPFIERHAADIIQPDCTKCGGLTEAWRIAWMAYEHNIQCVPHGWNTAIGLAADLHLSAAMPVARYVEYLTPSPYIEEIVATPFTLDADGMLAIPTGPGLGLDLDWDGIARFSRGDA